MPDTVVVATWHAVLQLLAAESYPGKIARNARENSDCAIWKQYLADCPGTYYHAFWQLLPVL